MKILTLSILLLLTGGLLHAQDEKAFEEAYLKKMDSLFSTNDTILGIVNQRPHLNPNGAGKGALTPTGWGSSGTHIFGGLGGTYPQLYLHSVDLAGSVGLCMGNAIKYVSVVAVMNINDVSAFGNFSYGLILDRYIGKTSGIAFGAENLFPNARRNDGGGQSYYLVFSHAVQTIPSKTWGIAKLTYSIGVGTGHYATKSPKDIAEGKGKYGTIVFGNISYEICKNANLNLEWTGINMGVSIGVIPFPKCPAITIGVGDLTRFSGDKAHLVFNIGHSLTFHR
jgi:hypothetical protein